MDTVSYNQQTQRSFAANYTLLQPGLITMRIRTRGETRKGSAFEGEISLNAVAASDNNTWPPDDTSQKNYVNG